MNIKELFDLDDHLTKRQMVALKNVLLVCKERVWLAETGGNLEYSTEFDQIMTPDQIDGIKASIGVIERLLERYNQLPSQ
jgi:hypothetical protein